MPSLESLEQLPEIESDDFVLVWDEEESQKYNETVIRYGNEVVWREFNYFECCDRFEEVARVLARKYCGRLKDIVPTRRSEINLFGNSKDSSFIVNKTRGNVWMNRY